MKFALSSLRGFSLPEYFTISPSLLTTGHFSKVGDRSLFNIQESLYFLCLGKLRCGYQSTFVW